MKKELASALNDQMVFELYSSYIYLGLAACLEKMKLPGAAHWMRIQVDEEIIHAGIFYNYLNDQSEDIVLDTIKKPELGKIKTPLDAFKEALKHEKLVTARINKLVELSIKSGGYATMAFLNLNFRKSRFFYHNLRIIFNFQSLRVELLKTSGLGQSNEVENFFCSFSRGIDRYCRSCGSCRFLCESGNRAQYQCGQAHSRGSERSDRKDRSG